MLEDLLYTFLLSLSPLGEARAGIPYAILNDIHFSWAFILGLASNLLIFPIFLWLMDRFNKKLLSYRMYKRAAVRLARRAKNLIGKAKEKYGFWALMIFVMIPLPGTGAYIGTIAAYVLKMDRRKAFMAVSIGVLISCLIVTTGMYFGNMGLERLAAKR